MTTHGSSLSNWLGATLLGAWSVAAPASTPAPKVPLPQPYTIEAMKVPETVAGQVAAVDFTPDGRPILLARSGELWLGDGEWKLWSSHGLEGATGIFAGYFPKSIYVTHATGITRLFDTDDDGRADFVKAVVPAWRFGTLGELFRGSPGVLAEGDLLISPHVTSGEWAGLVIRLPEARPVSPWLSGFSQVSAPSPGPVDGTWAVAGRGKSGEQSTGSAAIWVISEPATGGESDAPAEGKEMPAPPTLPAPTIHLPNSLMPTSPIRPAFPPSPVSAEESGPAFGDFSGQGFVAGETSKRLLRLMPELVGGQWQGAVTDFAAIESPEPGIGFLRFSPSGDQLLAGQGGHALSIRPAGGSLFAVRSVRLATDGFEVTFTKPVDRPKVLAPTRWKLRTWSPDKPESDTDELPLDQGARVVIDSDGLAATLQLPEELLKTELIYLFDLSGLLSEKGEKITHGVVYYTLNARHPTPAPAPAEDKPEVKPKQKATPETSGEKPEESPAPAPAEKKPLPETAEGKPEESSTPESTEKAPARP